MQRVGNKGGKEGNGTNPFGISDRKSFPKDEDQGDSRPGRHESSKNCVEICRSFDRSPNQFPTKCRNISKNFAYYLTVKNVSLANSSGYIERKEKIIQKIKHFHINSSNSVFKFNPVLCSGLSLIHRFSRLTSGIDISFCR